MRRLCSVTLVALFVLGFFVRASPAQPASATRGDGALVLTYNVDTETITLPEIRCGAPGGGHSRENRYYRVFDLSAYPQIAEGFHVTSVSAGVYILDFPDSLPAQEGTFRLYNLTHPPDGGIEVDSLEFVAETTFGGIAAPGERGFLATADIEGVFSPGALLTVEMELPSGDPMTSGLPEGFDIAGGGNAAGFLPDAPPHVQYLASDECGILIPTYIWGMIGIPGWVVTVTGTAVTTATEGEVPTDLRVDLYPNPTTGVARLDVQLDTPERVAVTVFDVTGRAVAALHDGAVTGPLALEFDGSAFPSGTYIVELRGETFRTTRTFFVLH